MPLAMPCRTILEETLVSENSLGENKPVGRVQGRSKRVVSNDRLVSILLFSLRLACLRWQVDYATDFG